MACTSMVPGTPGKLRSAVRTRQLIVAVTTENFDDARGKLNVQQSLMDRIRNVQESGLADEVIIEEYEGQKINDIQKYDVDIFAIGSDWLGKFDYLGDYCKVVYLDRTKGERRGPECVRILNGRWRQKLVPGRDAPNAYPAARKP